MAANRTFLASRARAPPRIAHDPEVARARLRGQPGITERSAYSTVTGPAEAGYEVNQKNRRRNRYQTRAHLPRLRGVARTTTHSRLRGRRDTRVGPCGHSRKGQIDGWDSRCPGAGGSEVTCVAPVTGAGEAPEACPVRPGGPGISSLPRPFIRDRLRWNG
jgi:hypothetical protein